jgi:NADPH-dependent 2,4-dienoyl-CoA reductase/sulfur reductase-like enzyme/Fe-S-cluster-containing hydrogenase component 2/bacterioferritin-associated ferredoxin
MKNEYSVQEHPILPVDEREAIEFYWKGKKLLAREGETIASALFANGLRIFGHHKKDGAPQGMFCANGQCAQCMVIADGLPVKSCMVQVTPGVRVEPVDGDPKLPPVKEVPKFGDVEEVEVECLIIGGGPAGLSAAIELGKLGVKTLIVDDKHKLGGKLVLQTHKFFGSIEACYAGTRGIDIATKLEKELQQYESVAYWLNTAAVSVFSDQKVGVVREGKEYVLIQPDVLLVAAGAREKSLAFKGNTLPGVYGAGAFQTLVNRDLVKPTEKLFIIGGGNVGLIAGYHALQAGIAVVGLVEVMPQCGGYKVHQDKLVRFGVPIYTSHTILSANGQDNVESVTIVQVDEDFQAIPGTEKSFECDTVLIAVGLDPVDEFYRKAWEFGMVAYAAGDAEEIAEASAAMFTGKIRGLEIARELGREVGEIPPDWLKTAEILKSKPGETITESLPPEAEGVFPVLHCVQEIPCNPCVSVCPQECIVIEEDDMRQLPQYTGNECTGCARCVAICPGLAITLVDYRKDPAYPTVTIPYEFIEDTIAVGDVVTVLDMEGQVLGNVEVVRVRNVKANDRTILVGVKAPKETAKRMAGIRVQEEQITEPMDHYVERLTDDVIICRCERVTAGEIRKFVREGFTDMNAIKFPTRAMMGACGSKTCANLIKRIFKEEGISAGEIVENVHRPLFMEVPLGVFCETEGNNHE